MGFKYINPGYANLLDTDKGIQLEGEQYNPDNKVAFWQPVAGNFNMKIYRIYCAHNYSGIICQ